VLRRASPSLSAAAAARAECGHRVGGCNGGGGGARRRGRENLSVGAEAAPRLLLSLRYRPPPDCRHVPPPIPSLPSTLIVWLSNPSFRFLAEIDEADAGVDEESLPPTPIPV
jgi:hypothetical protein